MKYYVVSERDLQYLRITAQAFEAGVDSRAALKTAEANCRARPVPDWATHFGEFAGTDEETGYELMSKVEWIPK
jgi:hypothetical protein